MHKKAKPNQMIQLKKFALLLLVSIFTSCGSLLESNESVSSCSGDVQLISNAIRYGALETSETWSGNITISGDILIGENCTLKIEPGTTITFVANSDSTSHGFTTPITDDVFDQDPATKPSEFSGIELWGGTLESIGTDENPITFTSSAESKVAGDWHSIAIRKTKSILDIQHSIIEYAYYGIQLNESTSDEYVTIQNNKIREIVACGVCLGVDLNKPVELTISDNEISACGHEGIDLHENATAIIENNLFFDNRGKFVGDPNESGGNGVVVDRSNNSIIRNNTFLRNNQGIACITDGTDPIIEDNTYGTGKDVNDDDIQDCPR